MYPEDLIIITRPDLGGTEEALWITHLLHLGVGRVHIRKPGAKVEELAPLLEAIPRELRRRCILSHHIDLVAHYHLGGVHLSVKDWRACAHRPAQLEPWQELGVSTHSRSELESLPFLPDYAYLSPLAPSLSKAGYGGVASWTEQELQSICRDTPFPLMALGGITPSNAPSFLRLGFRRVASLGYLQGLQLSELAEAVRTFCQPRLLLCGGIDPTSEAGITADARHAERLGARCYTILTAITRQDSEVFHGLMPLPDAEIVGQLEALRTQDPPAVAKIGLVSSLHQVGLIASCIRRLFPLCQILWDPILRTSSGYQVLEEGDKAELERAISAVDLLLPNRYEQEVLFRGEDPIDLAKRWSTILLAKSRRSGPTQVVDVAYWPNGCTIEQSSPRVGKDRHGTGCLYATELAVALSHMRTSGDNLSYVMGRAQRAVACYREGSILPPRERKVRLGKRMFITHGATPQEILRQTSLVLEQGLADVIQLRMKEAPWSLFLATAKEMQALCRSFRVPLLINDRVDIARLVDADGVHLGVEDLSPREARRLLGSEKLIGLTCHNRKELDEALTEPIDYVGLGPYRYTKTKKKLAPILGLEGYYQLQLPDYPLPVYAIGGIHPEEVPRLLDTGVYGIAMSSGLLRGLYSEDTPSTYNSLTSQNTSLC